MLIMKLATRMQEGTACCMQSGAVGPNVTPTCNLTLTLHTRNGIPVTKFDPSRIQLLLLCVSELTLESLQGRPRPQLVATGNVLTLTIRRFTTSI